MYLVRLRATRIGPFDDIDVSFENDGEPRLVTVVQGGGGIGKTTLLTAIANTRPGYAIACHHLYREGEEPGQIVCEYRLGQDDPERPHTLVIASPNARVYDDNDNELRRRKEQTLFDRVAREAGFVFVTFSAARGFSRAPILLTSPGRNLAHYDVRSQLNLEDSTRNDLARETKQCLSYATITKSLEKKAPFGRRFERLANAMEQAVNTLSALVGNRWVGIDPLTLEPVFEGPIGGTSGFDTLSTRARNLIAFAALTVRALWAAFPERDPLETEGVVAIDEADLYLDPAVQTKLVDALREALPRVQWILTTTSPFVASSCDALSTVTLRQRLSGPGVELYTNELARIH
jgi:hypothetical protein